MPYLKTLNGLAKQIELTIKPEKKKETVGINRIFELGGTFLT